MLIGPDINDTFVPKGFMEGYEYLVNSKASKLHEARLDEINSCKAPCEMLPEIKLSKGTRVFNTWCEPRDKVLIVDEGQRIINKYATANFFDELETINNLEALTSMIETKFIDYTCLKINDTVVIKLERHIHNTSMTADGGVDKIIDIPKSCENQEDCEFYKTGTCDKLNA
jgi:hypothetical protein